MDREARETMLGDYSHALNCFEFGAIQIASGASQRDALMAVREMIAERCARPFPDDEVEAQRRTVRMILDRAADPPPGDLEAAASPFDWARDVVSRRSADLLRKLG